MNNEKVERKKTLIKPSLDQWQADTALKSMLRSAIGPLQTKILSTWMEASSSSGLIAMRKSHHQTISKTKKYCLKEEATTKLAQRTLLRKYRGQQEVSDRDEQRV